MKILVFGGSGKIGSAVAWDLAHEPEVKQIGLIGRNKETLEKTRRWIGAGNIVIHQADVEDRKAVQAVMKQYDCGALALPDRRTSYLVVDAAIEAGLHIVDMLEEFHRTPDTYETEGLRVPKGMTLTQYGEWLHEQASKNKVTFLDGMGFAPGISNLTCGEGIRKLDKATHCIARVGGIPEKGAAEKHPLRYMITWAFEHVLREYMIKLYVRKGGKVVEVNAGTDRESFVFSQFGRNEPLECAVTPGMPSFMLSRPDLQEFAEKTVRWPGHWGGVQTLKECGMLDIEPIEYQGKKIVPREFLLAMIVPRLKPNPGETDVCVMYNTVKGVKNGKPTTIEYFMWDEADKKNGISSMMRATGYPVAIAARLLAKDEIKERGIVAPEDGIYGEKYQWFLRELEKRNINIKEVVTP